MKNRFDAGPLRFDKTPSGGLEITRPGYAIGHAWEPAVTLLISAEQWASLVKMMEDR